MRNVTFALILLFSLTAVSSGQVPASVEETLPTEVLEHGFADLIVILHAVFVLFVVGGQACISMGWWRGWNWTRSFVFRIGHLIAVGVVVVQSWLGLWCPLTIFENYLRRRGGEEGYSEGFLAHWIHRFIFYDAPAWVFTVVYTAFGLLVLLSFLFYTPVRRGRIERSRNET